MLVGTTSPEDLKQFLVVVDSNHKRLLTIQADGYVLLAGSDRTNSLAWMPPLSRQVWFNKSATKRTVTDAVVAALQQFGKAEFVDYSISDALVRLAIIQAEASKLP